MSQTTLTAIVKYQKRPRVVVIKQKVSFRLWFNFHDVRQHKILKEIKIWNKSKATQNTNIPIRYHY